MFSPKINISFEQNIVRFTKDHNILELKPVLYLDNNSPPRVLSAGTPPKDEVASRIVHLFDGKDEDGDKVLFLTAFLQFAILKIIGNRLSLRPNITFDISPELISRLGGYHSVILHYCAIMAGASSTPYSKKYKKA
jgi:hypothetical protein